MPHPSLTTKGSDHQISLSGPRHISPLFLARIRMKDEIISVYQLERFILILLIMLCSACEHSGSIVS
jgi:hypothetical protein